MKSNRRRERLNKRILRKKMLKVITSKKSTQKKSNLQSNHLIKKETTDSKTRVTSRFNPPVRIYPKMIMLTLKRMVMIVEN